MEKQLLWKHPKKVMTPDIKEDIRQFLSNEILILYNKCQDKQITKRIERIVEMLEFVYHLKVIETELTKIDKPIIKQFDTYLVKESHIQLWEHDFSGMPYDISALMLYLLVSIIDTCSDSQKKYTKCSEYLTKNNDFKTPEEVLKKAIEYDKKYGLSLNFKKVFTEDISEELQEELSSAILITNKNRKTIITINELSEIFSKWEKKSIKDKAKEIADVLYTIRSKYTHENIRAFLPSECSYLSSIDPEWRILIKEGNNLDELLIKVIKEQCKRILKGDNDK